jgi:hypothetical protein
MRKALVILLIAALSLSMLAFLAGCGSDANKDEAKNFMNAGDNYMDEVNTLWDTLSELETDIGTQVMSGDFSGLTGDAGAAMMQKFEDAFAGIDSGLKNAKTQYQSITSLDGVEDYKLYADKMLEAIDIDAKRLTSAQKLSTDSIAAFEQMQASGNIDLTALMGGEERQLLTDLEDQSLQLQDEAAQIKLDKKLSQ